MISFPGFGISLNVSRIAFTIFGINIYKYAVCIVFGIVLSMILCYKSNEKFNIKYDFVFESLMQAIIIGLIGARLYYVLFNLDYYIQSPLNIIKLRDGGLAIYGGLICGALAIINKCKREKVNCLDFFDYIAPFIALAQSIGRWGNFFNQEAYGYETKNIFRMGINTLNGYKEVHPTFLYESICTFIIFVVLRAIQKNRKFKGEICYLYLTFYSVARLFIENLRTDSLMIENVRVSQILSCAIFVVFGIMLLNNYRKYISKNYYALKNRKKSTKN